MCSCGFVKFLVVNVAPMFSPAGSQLPSLGLPDVLEVAVVLGAAHDVEAVVALARDGGVDGDHGVGGRGPHLLPLHRPRAVHAVPALAEPVECAAGSGVGLDRRQLRAY